MLIMNIQSWYIVQANELYLVFAGYLGFSY